MEYGEIEHRGAPAKAPFDWTAWAFDKVELLASIIAALLAFLAMEFRRDVFSPRSTGVPLPQLFRVFPIQIVLPEPSASYAYALQVVIGTSVLMAAGLLVPLLSILGRWRDPSLPKWFLLCAGVFAASGAFSYLTGAYLFLHQEGCALVAAVFLVIAGSIYIEEASGPYSSIAAYLKKNYGNRFGAYQQPKETRERLEELVDGLQEVEPFKTKPKLLKGFRAYVRAGKYGSLLKK